MLYQESKKSARNSRRFSDTLCVRLTLWWGRNVVLGANVSPNQLFWVRKLESSTFSEPKNRISKFFGIKKSSPWDAHFNFFGPEKSGHKSDPPWCEPPQLWGRLLFDSYKSTTSRVSGANLKFTSRLGGHDQRSPQDLRVRQLSGVGSYRIHAKVFPPCGPGILPGGGNFWGGETFA